MGVKTTINLTIKPNIMAIKKLESGPAKAINAPSLLDF